MRRQRHARLRGDRSGDRVIHGAKRRDFLNARILYLECFPGLIAAVERGDAGDVDEAGFEAFAIIPDYLLEDEAGKVPVGLLYLRDLVVLDVNVECDHFDTSIHRAPCGPFQGVGWAMLYDDAVDTKRDRLVDHFGLALGVLAAVEHLQVDAECLRLLFGAGEVGFKEIAGRKVANERHSDAARSIERGRQANGTDCTACLAAIDDKANVFDTRLSRTCNWDGDIHCTANRRHFARSTSCVLSEMLQ